MLMDLQLQASFTKFEPRFGFVIRMHFFTESETRFSVNPNLDSIFEYALSCCRLVVRISHWTGSNPTVHGACEFVVVT